MFKQLKFKLKYKNKFDFSAAYATYSLSNGFIARTASKNSALWVHLDYLTQNGNDEEKTKNYYKELKCEEFKQIVFVSKEARDNFLKLFPHCKENAIYLLYQGRSCPRCGRRGVLRHQGRADRPRQERRRPS